MGPPSATAPASAETPRLPDRAGAPYVRADPHGTNSMPTPRARALAAATLLPLAAPLGAQTVAQADSAARAAARLGTLPLIPERRLTFTADEGTWISLDVAPDGKTLVFDLLGDLYTLPIAGGAATRITSGLA